VSSKLDLLHSLTSELVTKIQEAEPEQLLQLVELREEVIQELSGMKDISQSVKEQLQFLGKCDVIILNRMNEIKDEAGSSVGKIKASRHQRRLYESNSVPDSYFFDKKK
jgi:hypothetical protein